MIITKWKKKISMWIYILSHPLNYSNHHDLTLLNNLVRGDPIQCTSFFYEIPQLDIQQRSLMLSKYTILFLFNGIVAIKDNISKFIQTVYSIGMYSHPLAGLWEELAHSLATLTLHQYSVVFHTFSKFTLSLSNSVFHLFFKDLLNCSLMIIVFHLLAVFYFSLCIYLLMQLSLTNKPMSAIMPTIFFLTNCNTFLSSKNERNCISNYAYNSL